jgi:hypothetical protein
VLVSLGLVLVDAGAERVPDARHRGEVDAAEAASAEVDDHLRVGVSEGLGG